MMHGTLRFFLLLGTLVAFVAPASAAEAHAVLKDGNGKALGKVTLRDTADGVLLQAVLEGLPAGEHAFHVHAVGKCEPPFTSAGEHFNPGGKKHGLMTMEGHHAGDMPNLHIPQGGALITEIVNSAITLDKGKPNSVFQPGGTALIVHAGKDDYKTDPTGEAGGRIACGVIE